MSIPISENTAQAITANRLSDGFVVYLTARNDWSERFEDCQSTDDEQTAESLLARARHHADEGHVVSPYLFRIQHENGKPVALGRREIIRTSGPSVGTDLARG
ncbi:MAG: DUF2849 domain-containing protein [Alphaproteobacteria bacterium]|nr:DUF2849 domain-containing protein [Alphaproteobacteria bacterium]